MKKNDTMQSLTKRAFLCGFSMLLIGGLSPAARAANCSLATVAGSYAVTTLGQAAGVWTLTVFRITNDGRGNVSGAGAEAINGTIHSGVTTSGTYTVKADCSFTSTTTDSLGTTRNIAGAIFQNGGEATGISTDAGTEIQFTAYRQQLTACTISSGAGKFVAQIQSPLTPFGPSIAFGQWTVNNKGNGFGTTESNFGGTIVSGTATVTFSINSDCTFTSTTISNGTTGHSFGVGGINQNDVASVFMGTDSGWVSLATTYKK